MREIASILLIFVVFSTSCMKIRDDLLPDNNTKIFCQSILSPDSIISVYVGKTTGISDMEPSNIEDATVLLYTNEMLVDTLTHGKSGKYSSNLKPYQGNQYSVKVIKDGTLTGKTIIPVSTHLIGPMIEFPTGYDAVNQQYFGELTFTIDDDPDTENFYEIIIFTKKYNHYTNSFYYSFHNNPNYILLPDPIVQNEGDWDYLPNTVFFSDKMFNGKRYLFAFSIVATRTMLPDGKTSSNSLKDDGYIFLRSISKEYYMYRKYYTRHAYNAGIRSDGIQNLLFTGEPLDMYTNITGGLGVFAGFSSTISKIQGHK